MDRDVAKLKDPRRLQVLHSLGMLDSLPEESFDRYTRLIARCAQVPVALLSLVDDTRQFFKSCVGLTEGVAPDRQTPLSHSFCQHVVTSGEPLIINDARLDPLVRENGAVKDLGVIAYAGVPLRMANGEVLGSLCAIDTQPRQWSEADIELLRTLAEAVMSEIGLREARKAAEAANAAKDRFLAVLSHELRTPLTPVLLTVTALETDDTLRADLLSDIKLIRRNVEIEARLIDDLLDLTRIARGKLELHEADVDAHELVRQGLSMSKMQMVQKQITVTTALEAGRFTVRGDAARLQQVLWNLAQNAAKFTGKGGRVEVRTDNPDPQTIRFRVIDNGIGIDAANVERIFNAFEQSGSLVTRQFGGLGLGLAICKAIVELHGGRISATSPGAGLGATLTFTLPVIDAVPLGALNPAAGDASASDKLNILYVEDHEQTANAVMRLLQSLEHRVTHADTVASAIDAGARQRFDLLICDLGLPDGSGLDVLRHIRLRQDIKSIAFTGYGLDEDVRRTTDAGFTAHLTKPVTFDALLAAIAAIQSVAS